MDSKVFDEIMENLNKRVQWCDEHLGPLTSPEAIKNLTIGDYLKIKAQCKVYHSEMDKIYCEVRHLLTMADMTMVQQSKFLSALRRFSAYRPDIKRIDSHNDVNSLPSIPVKSTYTLSVLSNVTLVREARGKAVAIEDETNETVTKVEVKEPEVNNKQPYNMEYSPSGKSIVITYNPDQKEQLEALVENFNEALGTDKSKLRKNLKKVSNHYNIGFSVTPDDLMEFRLLLSDENQNNEKGKITKYFKQLMELQKGN